MDPAWAPATERQITDDFAARGPAGSRLRSATCKTTLCAIEIGFPPGPNKRSFVNWPSFFGFSRGYIARHPSGPDEHARTVTYLARDGHPLSR